MRNLLKVGLKRMMGTVAEPPRPRRAHGPRHAVVIAVAAQKGGVGKTTTSVNLAAALARNHGKRVLLIDLDPQGHVSRALSAAIHPGGGALSDVLTTETGLEVMDVITSTVIDNLDVTPFDPQLGGAENQLSARIGKELVLREALAVTRTFYDIILVDCPPNLGNLTLNGLVAADQVLVPCDPSPLALTGVHGLVEAVRAVSARLNPDIDVLGVLLTRVDGRNTTLNQAMVAEIEESYGEALFSTRIGVSNSLPKAQHAGQDIFSFDAESRGAVQYAELAMAVVQRLGAR